MPNFMPQVRWQTNYVVPNKLSLGLRPRNSQWLRRWSSWRRDNNEIVSLAALSPLHCAGRVCAFAQLGCNANSAHIATQRQDRALRMRPSRLLTPPGGRAVSQQHINGLQADAHAVDGHPFPT